MRPKGGLSTEFSGEAAPPAGSTNAIARWFGGMNGARAPGGYEYSNIIAPGGT